MKATQVSPEKGQKTVWLIHWSLLFFPILLACLALTFVVNELVFGICSAFWMIFGLPFLFWISAYFRSLEYTITHDSVQGEKGVFWKRFVTIPYQKITNVDVTQGPLQRKYNVGTIHCQTAGAGGQQGATAELKMEGIGDLDGLKEAIMERVKDHIPSRREEMGEKVEGGDDADTLSDVLGEIRAIREFLEKQRDR